MQSARDAAPKEGTERATQVRTLFSEIAPRYDLLNHLLSAGIDKRWRTRAIQSLQLTGQETLIDVCTGTADVALTACAGTAGSRGAARVLGVDFAGVMLKLGLDKVRASGQERRISLVRGDAMRLPAPSASADAATVAFGVRNVQDPAVACAEMARVLRPGGRLAILEFGVPRIPGLRGLYRWYFTAVLPRVGRAISGHSAAYSYLPASVGAFTPTAEFVRILERSGFVEVKAEPLTFGIVYLYTGRRAATP